MIGLTVVAMGNYASVGLVVIPASTKLSGLSVVRLSFSSLLDASAS